MSQGHTQFKEQCHYLVRRPSEIFLKAGESAPEQPEPDHLTEEQLLIRPVYIQYRPLEDPRAIRMLDPACGSMHFGLYAFDLFEGIYDESWEIAHGSDEVRKSSVAFAPFMSFVAQYADKATFLTDVPRLILENNLHGIDIDPRAVQIAGLSLWLRAQRSWQRQDLRPQDRPRIRRSNIVCAESMPGEEAFLNEFIEEHLSPTPERKLLGQLVRRVFDAMNLAGEAGSLLKIEEKIVRAVTEAKEKWLAAPKLEQGRLFADDQPVQRELGFDITGITDETFWQKAEEQIYGALQNYAVRAEQNGAYQRRLFADDAARGFAFIDLCRKRYDVVLMNPPFGLLSAPSKAALFTVYPTAKEEMMNAMILASMARLNSRGKLGCIGNRTVFFLANHEEWRRELFSKIATIDSFVDLGHGVLDGALVETAAFVFSRGVSPNAASLFLSALNGTDKESALNALFNRSSESGRVSEDVHVKRLSDFRNVPGFRLSYSIPAEFLSLFGRTTLLDPQYGEVIVGLQTSDNERFLRLVWEVEANRIGQSHDTLRDNNDLRWAFFAKGGEYAPYFSDIHLVCEWQGDGSVMKAFASAIYGHWSHNIHHPEFYFHPGLTFSRRTASSFNPRVLPSGCLFGEQGPTIFPKVPFDRHPLALLAICHSRVFQAFIELMVASGDTAFSGSAARTYERGVVGNVPIIEPNIEQLQQLELSARKIVDAQRLLDAQAETSRFFVAAHITSSRGNVAGSLREAFEVHLRETEHLHLQSLDATFASEKLVLDIYNLQSDTKAWIESEFGPHPNQLSSTVTPPDVSLEAFREVQAMSDEKLIAFLVSSHGGSRFLTKKTYFSDRRLELLCHRFGLPPRKISDLHRESGAKFESELLSSVALFISYSFGSVFGRWDIRFATSEKTAPELPDPFAPLPVCPPGQLHNTQGLPITKEEVEGLKAEGRWNYPIEIAWDGILVDDPDNAMDIEARVHRVLQVIWKDRWEAIEREICEILGVRTVRDYFRKPIGFFADHLKRYSKSRRQGPIYWPLSTASGSYTLWIYYQRLTDELLFTAVNKYVKPKIETTESQIHRIQSDLQKASGPNASQLRNVLESAKTSLDELHDFRDELLRVADLPYRPDLNDGVLISASPLWKLFRLPKWRADLKECWEKLAEGKYDWAHLAWSIWPDRVRDACKRDRSIAIAHGLETLCEVPVKPSAKKQSKKAKAAEMIVGEAE